MTDKNYTALVFLVDKSGSMYGIARDMEGAIETLLEEQQKLPGKLTVDITYFDAPGASQGYWWNGKWSVTTPDNNWYEEAYHLADPADVTVSLNPRGGTALYDALGRKVTEFGQALAAMPEDERPGRVIFAIVTDGGENSSREYLGATVKALVERQTNEFSWNFTYLGANQDAVLVGTGLGIAAGSTLTWNTNNVYAGAQSLSAYTTATRSGLAASYTDEDRANNA